MSGAYDDIIHLPHHVSATRPHMSIIDRAAQFSPFAALTGFDAAITETGRLTDEKIELDEYEKVALNDKLNKIAEQLDSQPVVTITYFRPDDKKTGGAYVTTTGIVKKIDEYKRVIILSNKMEITLEDVLEITSIPKRTEEAVGKDGLTFD